MSDATHPEGAEPTDPGRDPDDELIIEPDDDSPSPMPPVLDDGTPDADRALRGAGGDGDRAEDLLEEQRAAAPTGADVPDAERPA